MGLLDDAIREHLDLKRRRGADPTELAQAERDALGPVRRERESAASDEPLQNDSAPLDLPEGTDPGLPLAPSTPRLAVDPEIDWDDATAQAAETAAAPAPVSASVPLHERGPASAGEETVEYRLDDSFDEEPAEQPAASPGAVSRLRSRFGRQQPAPAPEEGVEVEKAPPDPNDVLEETPDFLQDTPDHDRLWFEQKPPRDFDFDG